MTRQWISCADTAKLLRAALKERFPDIKFSIRSKVYSGGASIDVRVPRELTKTESVVARAICRRFEGATFDGMIDLKSSVTHVVDGREVRYGSDYVFLHSVQGYLI